MDIPEQSASGLFANFPPAALKVKETGEWLAGLVKITTIFSAILGAPLVWIYMVRVGAPFPSVDAALALFLLVFTMMVAVLVFMILLMLMFPIAIKQFADKPVREYFPGLYKKSGKPAESLKCFLKDYVKLYLPSILLPILVVISYWMNIDSHVEYYMPTPVLLLAVSMSGIFCPMILALLANRKENRKWYSNFWGVLVFVSFANLFLLFWLSSVPILFPDVFYFISRSSDFVGTLIFLGTFLPIFLFHGMLTRGELVPRRMAALGMAVAIVLVMVFPGGSVLAATALRMLGFGGGMPVTITVKRLDERKGVAEARKLSGCLILQTGSAIVFKIEEADARRCRLESRPFEPFQAAAPFDGIVQFQRADVTEIEGFQGKARPIPLPPPRSIP
ncbi:hypothetical protein CRT60_31220 [Azospirillum palustre]|uniref:Uncharacterized protein n=2 Tax=Azospirillum palustre TaxID=2044885 RepID=A0A2B8AZ77_9PROT|nr:hypothetical protein CRT60_31220 [Azospirillum palustre]